MGTEAFQRGVGAFQRIVYSSKPYKICNIPTHKFLLGVNSLSVPFCGVGCATNIYISIASKVPAFLN